MRLFRASAVARTAWMTELRSAGELWLALRRTASANSRISLSLSPDASSGLTVITSLVLRIISSILSTGIPQGFPQEGKAHPREMALRIRFYR